MPRQEQDKNENVEKCKLCGKPLAGETWTDSEEYGDVHERCVREREGG